MFDYHVLALLSNSAIWVAALSAFSAQVLKVLIEYAHFKKINFKMVYSTGGMPSSHAALVVALAASIGASEGLYSPVFAVALAFAAITMHDAAGVRRAAGEHAEIINKLLDDLHDSLQNIGFKPDKKLKELLGHSPLEVIAGAIWGLIVTGIIHGLLGV